MCLNARAWIRPVRGVVRSKELLVNCPCPFDPISIESSRLVARNCAVRPGLCVRFETLSASAGSHSNRELGLCWIRHQILGSIISEPTGPFRIVLTEHHFAWLSVQCKEMRVTKEDLIFNALLEWTRRTGPAKLPSVGLSCLVFLALEDFIRRHRSEFLPLGGDDKNWSALWE
jgi:hypothetical protein